VLEYLEPISLYDQFDEIEVNGIIKDISKNEQNFKK